MTTPGSPELLTLLGLVDPSRARATAAEAGFRAEMAQLYAARLAELESEDSSESSELLTAVVLTALVLTIRRAFASGVNEGIAFAVEQFSAVGVSPDALRRFDFANNDIPDQLIRDFLAGQIVAVKTSKSRRDKFSDLSRRGDLAVVSAYQAGRGWATEQALDVLAEELSGQLHKLWVARFDLVNPPCPLCVRLHGRHVPVGQAFSIPDTEPAAYFSPLQAPPRHPNCRCSLVLYLPDSMSPKVDVTPLSMQAYAEWKLTLASEGVLLGGTTFTAQEISEALAVLAGLEPAETGVARPLKAAGSPLAELSLSSVVNGSAAADPFRGANGSVHYSKMRPALAAVLQDALASPGR